MRLLDRFRKAPAIAGAGRAGGFPRPPGSLHGAEVHLSNMPARAPACCRPSSSRSRPSRRRWKNRAGGTIRSRLQSAAVMAEHALRPHAGGAAQAMRSGLIASRRPHLRAAIRCRPGEAPDFWRRAQERIARRIAQAGLAAPHAVKDIPQETAKEFFEGLPIHADLRSFDFELITNNLRVNLCRAHEDFVAAADLPGGRAGARRGGSRGAAAEPWRCGSARRRFSPSKRRARPGDDRPRRRAPRGSCRSGRSSSGAAP